jgi:hypothetical protein
MRLFEIFQPAMYQAGHLFEEETTGITAHVARLLKQHGCKQVQTRDYELEFRAGTPGGEAYCAVTPRFFRNLRPFLEKWGHVPEDYESIYQQALIEMQQADFVGRWNLRTAWGNKA